MYLVQVILLYSAILTIIGIALIILSTLSAQPLILPGALMASLGGFSFLISCVGFCSKSNELNIFSKNMNASFQKVFKDNSQDFFVLNEEKLLEFFNSSILPKMQDLFKDFKKEIPNLNEQVLIDIIALGILYKTANKLSNGEIQNRIVEVLNLNSQDQVSAIQSVLSIFLKGASARI